MELCDRVTVLRKGKCLGTYDISEMTQERISNLMIGRELAPSQYTKVEQARSP